MIRGNEKAIDLGLEILASLNPGRPLSKTEIAEVIEAIREEIGGARKPFTKQDMFFLEDRALRKMHRHARKLRRVQALEYIGISETEVRAAAKCKCGLYHGHPGFCRGQNPRAFWDSPFTHLRLRLDRKAELISLFRTHESLSIHDIRNLMGLRRSQALNFIAHMRAAGVVRSEGHAQYSRWKLSNAFAVVA